MTDQRFECCGRPMNPMRAGTGRTSDELSFRTYRTTVRAPRPGLSLAGRFRVYFNRHQAAPLVWCVRSENGNFELAVAQVDIAAPTRTVYRPKDTPDDEDGLPSAWLEVDGVVNVDINSPIVSISRAP